MTSLFRLIILLALCACASAQSRRTGELDAQLKVQEERDKIAARRASGTDTAKDRKRLQSLDAKLEGHRREDVERSFGVPFEKVTTAQIRTMEQRSEGGSGRASEALGAYYDLKGDPAKAVKYHSRAKAQTKAAIEKLRKEREAGR